MKLVGWMIAVAVTLSCTSSHRGGVLPELPREYVVDRDVCIDIWRCPRFIPFYRAEDAQHGRVNWLLSNQRHACVVSDADFVSVPDHQPFACAWRMPRPSGVH